MDKYFEPINRHYLSQPPATINEELLKESLRIARAYAIAENAIVSMGDSIRNCSYCFSVDWQIFSGCRSKTASPPYHRFMKTSFSAEQTPTT